MTDDEAWKLVTGELSGRPEVAELPLDDETDGFPEGLRVFTPEDDSVEVRIRSYANVIIDGPVVRIQLGDDQGCGYPHCDHCYPDHE